MSDEVRFGLKPLISGGGNLDCSDKLCSKPILNGNQYFIDLLKSGNILCMQCGQCLRYARKKASERGEPVELAEV